MQKIFYYFLEKGTWLQQVFLFLCFILVSGILSACIGQDLNYDLLQYHFYNGYAFLQQRLTHDVAPAMIQTYLNPFFDVINYYLIKIQHPVATEFLLGSFSGIGGFILYKISQLFFSDYTEKQQRIYGLYSIVIGMSGAASISLLNTTTNDTKMSVMIILALYWLIKAAHDSASVSIRYVVLSGLLTGLTVGFKLTAACYAVGMFIAFFIMAGKLNRQHILQCTFLIFCMVAGFLLANGHWMYVLNEQFQNPFFPYFNHIFHSPYAPFISFNLPPVEETLSFYHYLFFFFYVAVKSHLTAEVALRDPRLLFLFIMCLVVLIKYFCGMKVDNQRHQQANDIRAIVMIFFGVSYVIWLFSFAVYRYMLPLEWLIGILIVYMTIRLIESQWMQHIFLCAALFLLVAATHYPDWHNRNTYHQTYFSVTTPAVPVNSIILLTTVPMGYVIPFFPASVQFIGMPFVNLGIDKVIPAQVNKRKILLETMQSVAREIKWRPVYTLSFQQEDRFTMKSQKMLNYFGLEQVLTDCKPVITNLEGKHNKLKLCAVRVLK